MAHVKATFAEISLLQKINQRTVRDGQFSPSSMIILGGAGGGKSQWCKNEFAKIVAEARGLAADEVVVELTQAAIRDDQEYAGVGVPQKSDTGLVTRFSLPNLIERINELRDAGAKCIILVVDEVSAASDAIQKLFAPVADKFDHRLGDHALGNDVVIAMTGNRAKDKAGSRRLLAHLPNRACVYDLQADHAAGADWLEAHEGHPLLVAAIRSLDGFISESAPTEDGQMCSMRQVEQTSDWLKTAEEIGEFTDYVTPLLEKGIASYIGLDAAAMLTSFARQLAEGIPSAAEIFAAPLTAKVPSNPASQQFAINRAIAEIGSYGPEAGNNAFAYANRLSPDLAVVVGVKVARASVRNNILLNSDLAGAFMVKHHDLIQLTAT